MQFFKTIKKGSSDDVKEKMVDVFQLPKDIILGASIVTVIGMSEVWVENYKGILECTNDSIVLQGKRCQIGVYGKQLTIDYYTSNDMKIYGRISAIKYF